MIRGGANAERGRAGLTEGGHRPALDGLRALAVAAVVLFHLDRLPGGNLGVDAFFVLSGWLITTRVLAASDRSPRPGIDLRAFWAARARRLMPASLSVLVAVAVLWRASGIDVPSLQRDLMWALGWASNWGTITGGGDYWARFGEPSPVTHFWSLAVEEQFYVAWPLLLYPIVRFGARRRDALVGTLSLALAAASVAYMVRTFDAAQVSDTYLNTLARAHNILIGAAAAAITAGAGRREVAGRVARRLLPIAATVVVGLVAISSEGSTWLFSWGFPTFAIAMAVVVVAAADDAAISWLGSRPLRWVGDRSYGIYLWHWPVILFLRGDRAPLDGLPLDVLRVVVAVGLAAVSYRWLEMPIRRRSVVVRRAPVVALGAAVAAVAVVTLMPVSTVQQPVEASAVRLPDADRPAARRPAASAGISLSSLPTEPTEVVEAVQVAPAGPVRVLVVGDSTAVHLSRDLLAYAAAHPDEVVAGSAAYAGCGLTVAGDGRRHSFTNVDGEEDTIDLSGCIKGWNEVVDRVASDEGIDTVLVYVGTWDGSDLHFPDGRVVSVVDPAGRRLVAEAYGRFVEQVESAGARVVWVTPPDIHLAWGGITSPLDDPRRWDALRDVVDELPVEQVDLPTWLRRNGLDGPQGRDDGVHLVPEVNARFVAEQVVPTLTRLGPPAPTATRAGVR